MGFSYDDTLLGKKTAYCSHYSPELLFPVPRQDKRKELGIKSDKLPFHGWDQWTGYELSWLNHRRLPQVAVGHFIFPAESPFLIESKSFKLYLNSFNDTPFSSWQDVRHTLERDLSRACGAHVRVELLKVNDSRLQIDNLPDHAICLDDMDIAVDSFDPSPEFLHVEEGSDTVEEMLCSHLLKSNCLVTGQPDWGTVLIEYAGQPIDRAGLLRYIVSFRHHWEFHEQCAERIFMDILRRCQPRKLTVQARYLRRGGLDINPVRSTHPVEKNQWLRLSRQ